MSESKSPVKDENHKDFYSTRKAIRRRLRDARNADRNQTPERYRADAEALDAEMESLGFLVKVKTKWCR